MVMRQMAATRRFGASLSAALLTILLAATAIPVHASDLVEVDLSELEGTLQPGTEVGFSLSVDWSNRALVTVQIQPAGICDEDFYVVEDVARQPLEIACSFDPALFLDEPWQQLGIYVYAYDANATPDGEGVHTLLEAMYPLDVVGFDPPSFFDTRGTTHDEAIEAIAAAGVTGGYPDGTFRPNEDVTRGQMARFLMNALELEPSDEVRFSDSAGTTHQEAIEAIAAAGVTGGYPDGTFRPNENVTRGQMARFLVNALGL